MSNNMDKYFDKARKNLNIEPLYSKNELRSKLENESGKIFSPKTKHISKFTRSLKMKLIISTIIAIVTSTWFYFDKPADNNPVQEAQAQASVTINSIDNTREKAKVQSENPSIETKQTDNNTNSISETVIDNPQDSNTLTPASNTAVVKDTPSDNNESYEGIRVLRLTDEELEKIGIKKFESGYEFIGEREFSHYYHYKLDELGYDTTLVNGLYREKYVMKGTKINHEMQKYTGWDLSKSELICPLDIRLYWGKSEKWLGLASINGASHLAEFVPAFWNDEDTKFFEHVKFERAKTYSNINEELKKSELYPYKSQLVPVFIELQNDKYYSYVTLWYVPNEKFLNAIPEKYKKELFRYIKPIDKLKTIKEVEEKYQKKNLDYEVNVKPIATINLTLEELKPFGITYNKGKISYITEIELPDNVPPEYKEAADSMLREEGYDPENAKYIRNKIVFDSAGSKKASYKYTGWDTYQYSKLYPIASSCQYSYYSENNYRKPSQYLSTIKNNQSPLYTDIGADSLFSSVPLSDQFRKDEKTGSMLFYWDGNKRKYDMSKLIPVYLHLDSVLEYSELESSIDMVFWFIPTKEFIDALPENYADKLRKELQLIEDISNGEVNPEDACERLNSESYFGLCGLNYGALKNIKVYPNPVTPMSQLSFDLEESRKLSIRVHDLEGKSLATLASDKAFDAGTHEFPLKFKDLSSGVYMISVTSDENEQVVIKVLL